MSYQDWTRKLWTVSSAQNAGLTATTVLTFQGTQTSPSIAANTNCDWSSLSGCSYDSVADAMSGFLNGSPFTITRDSSSPTPMLHCTIASAGSGRSASSLASHGSHSNGQKRREPPPCAGGTASGGTWTAEEGSGAHPSPPGSRR